MTSHDIEGLKTSIAIFETSKAHLKNSINNMKGKITPYQVGRMSGPKLCTIQNVVFDYQGDIKVIVKTDGGHIRQISPEDFVL